MSFEGEALLRRYFEVLDGGGIDALWGLVSDDCRDHNPMRGQLPGKGGVIMKVILFRREHPDARVVVESIEPVPGGARATWTTTAVGLNGSKGKATWRFSAVFEIGEKLRSSQVTSTELVREEYE